MPIREEWLQQQQEEILEPELSICDPHHHLWDYPESRYLLPELIEDVASHKVVSTVFVECLSNYFQRGSSALAPVGETKFVEEIAEQSAQGEQGATLACKGIISFADLLLGAAVEEVLEAHQQASPTRFRGIRHSCSWDASDAVRNSHTKPPQHLYLNQTFRQGFAKLAEKNLVFDAWLYHTQLEELLSLARAFPEQPIVLDHVGGPLGIGPYQGRQEEVFQIWSKRLTDLATCPNVYVKLGGLGMPINGFGWHQQASPPNSKILAENNAPYFLHCIDVFGVQRCMFESNFPVDKVSASYAVLWNSFKRIVADFQQSEKEALFHDTAVTVYQLS